MQYSIEELTEFAELVRENPTMKIESLVKGFVDYYSVGSSPDNKAPALVPIEHEKKICQYYGHCSAKDTGTVPYCKDTYPCLHK